MNKMKDSANACLSGLCLAGTVLFRLVVKVYQHYVLDFSARAARSAEMRSPEKGTYNE